MLYMFLLEQLMSKAEPTLFSKNILIRQRVMSSF